MRLLTSTLVVAALAAAAGAADAQVPQSPRPERPYRGLFAGDTDKAKELLTFSASFGGGYDDDIFASGQLGVGGAPTPGHQPSTSFLMGSANLGYSLSQPKLTFTASGGTGLGHYPGLSQPSLVHHNGQVGVSYQVGRHSTISAQQLETYQPFYFYAWLPTAIVPIDPTPVFDPGTMTIADAVKAASLGVQQPVAADAVAAPSADYYLASDTNVSYIQGLSERLSAYGTYSYRRTDSKSGNQNFQSQAGTGGMKYVLSKGLGLRADYTYTDTSYPSASGLSTTEYHGSSINAGVDFNKALSFSRRTMLSFATGTSAVNDGIQTHYNVVGNVYLTREIGRSWSSGIGYYRDVNYTETFRAPVLTDTASAGISGLLNRNAQLSAQVGAARGDVGYGSANGYSAFFATSNIRFALTRNVALSVNYGYYRYRFEDGIYLPPGASRDSNRQSISFSIDFWKPLIQRNRS